MAMKPVSVSQINGYVKRVLQSDPILGNVAVVGEIANLKYHTTGHVYFSLKDDSSKLQCFLPSSYAAHLRYELADGMEITAFGNVSVFERGGTYSLNVRDVEVNGLGNLAQAFEALKEKLGREGLFDAKYKKPVARFPKKIAIVTAPGGAAVRDLIKVLRGRNPFVDLIVVPVLVQGPGAAPDIAGAIDLVNRRFPDVDTIITGRGGGSQEELWAFNEEIVARAIFLSEIPVISAVGHETDVSISDFVADLRAATPTEAAVLATEDIGRMALRAEELRRSLFRTGLSDRIGMLAYRTKNERSELLRALETRLESGDRRAAVLKTELEALSPFRILERGYAAVLDERGRTVASVADTTPGSRLTVLLKDGRIHTEVTSLERAEAADPDCWTERKESK